MVNYKLLQKGFFESKFEERLNAAVLEGWKAISITSSENRMTVLLEKNR